MRTALGSAAAIAVAALLAAGCGSGGQTTSTTASSAVDWANSFCTATTTWQTALKGAVGSLKSGPYSKSDVQAAADKMKTATQTYVDALEGLGAPGTQAGKDAKSSLDALQTQMQSGVDTIKKATQNVSGASGVLNAVSVVSGTLVTMGNEAKSTVSDLQSLDPKGELQQAFAQADACASLSA